MRSCANTHIFRHRENACARLLFCILAWTFSFAFLSNRFLLFVFAIFCLCFGARECFTCWKIVMCTMTMMTFWSNAFHLKNNFQKNFYAWISSSVIFLACVFFRFRRWLDIYFRALSSEIHFFFVRLAFARFIAIIVIYHTHTLWLCVDVRAIFVFIPVFGWCFIFCRSFKEWKMFLVFLLFFAIRSILKMTKISLLRLAFHQIMLFARARIRTGKYIKYIVREHHFRFESTKTSHRKTKRTRENNKKASATANIGTDKICTFVEQFLFHLTFLSAFFALHSSFFLLLLFPHFVLFDSLLSRRLSFFGTSAKSTSQHKHFHICFVS